MPGLASLIAAGMRLGKDLWKDSPRAKADLQYEHRESTGPNYGYAYRKFQVLLAFRLLETSAESPGRAYKSS